MILQSLKQAAAHLLAGGIGVIPTDTVFGVVARAYDQEAVEKLYVARGRSQDKACIMLIAGLHQVADAAAWTDLHYKLANTHWPGALSLLAPITEKTPHYLHRGTGGLVYRVPAIKELRDLLEQTGPLLAPSANPQGEQPATTLEQAKAYFGDLVHFYVDGPSSTNPSTIAAIRDGKVHILRQGSVQVSL